MKPLSIFSRRRRRRRRRVSINQAQERADVPPGYSSDRMVLILLMVGLVTLGGSAVGTAMASGEFIDSGHLVWTPIGQSLTRSEVDLWTKTSSGCPCASTDGSTGGGKGKGGNKACACCAHEGACQCGPRIPYRCAQCGLEEHCDQMCNVTLDAGQLFAASKLRYGQIKSLELRENQHCWYRLLPAPGFRIELQIYRLVDIGQLNQSKCSGGQLEWITNTNSGAAAGQQQIVGSSNSGNRHHVWTLCGPNERYSPPSLFFSDDDVSPATLILKSGDSTRRGKLLAHFSFTPIAHQAPLGLQIVGASPVHGQDCEWVYQQADCLTDGKYGGSCRMASPGYPGLYPPERTCRYHVALQSPFQPLLLQFISVQLPFQRCITDNIRIFVNGRLRTTLCGQQTTQFVTHGPDVTVEFNSGALLVPYVFNGFLAQLSFRPVEDQQQQQPQQQHHRNQHTALAGSASITDPSIPLSAFRAVERQAHAVCDYIIRLNATSSSSSSSSRSGFFSTAITAWRVWPAPCSFTFPVQPGHSVQISILSYNLTGDDCTSFFEIQEGSLDVRWSSSSPSQKTCSPGWMKSRNSYSKFNQPFLVQSHNSSLSIRFRMDPAYGLDQIIEGAFAYYNEYDGQRRSGKLCESSYDGETSPSIGRFSYSYDSTLFWSIAGPFSCSSTFFPSGGQSVILTVVGSKMKDEDGLCFTECDRVGCHCRMMNQSSVESVDHVILSLATNKNSTNSLCLCGDVQAFLPLKLSSNTPVIVRHHVADFSFGRPGLQVDFLYNFSPMNQYGINKEINILSTPTGSLVSSTYEARDRIDLNDGYYHADYIWVAKILPGQQWISTIYSPEQGNCEDWNVTFHYYDENWSGKLGQTVHFLCPDTEKQVFAMPNDMTAMAIRLQAWNTAPVEYRIDWQTIVQQPTGVSPAPGVQRSLSSLITSSSAPSLSEKGGAVGVQVVSSGAPGIIPAGCTAPSIIFLVVTMICSRC